MGSDRTPMATCCKIIKAGTHWRLKLSLSIAILFWSHLALSQAKDTLYFYNKTKIVGKLLNIRLGRLEFDAEGVGIISIKNTKIEFIHATSRSFRVETIEGKELQGYLLRSDTSGMVVVHAIVESEHVKIDDITGLVFYGQTVRSRMTGNLSAGFTYTKSSDIGRLNSDGVVRYNTRKSLTLLEGDVIVTSDSSEISTERANVAISHEQTFAPLWGAIAVLRYQRNLELGLERRLQEVLGVGRGLLISNRQLASVYTGVAVNQERNEQDVSIGTVEGMVAARYDFYSFTKPNMTFSFYEAAFASLTETDRLRLDGEVSLEYELITDFYVTFSFYHNFDSRSPATGAPNIDYGFVAGLRYKF